MGGGPCAHRARNQACVADYASPGRITSIRPPDLTVTDPTSPGRGQYADRGAGFINLRPVARHLARHRRHQEGPPLWVRNAGDKSTSTT